jgi:hypothetical protein
MLSLDSFLGRATSQQAPKIDLIQEARISFVDFVTEELPTIPQVTVADLTMHNILPTRQRQRQIHAGSVVSKRMRDNRQHTPLMLGMNLFLLRMIHCGIAAFSDDWALTLESQ